ncbi:mucin-13b isoform X2 [Triplophysa dalaica]|uniref:mucin-13b isoform X2 n=1 Tax=Triplophysa dalaica TaxID=1582913 RepID=UPI0024E03A28|nr:mucin-13b isoform X2 [Triplophysa dalaica]
MHKLFKSILCFCLVAASAVETNNQSSTTTITQATNPTTMPPTTGGTTVSTTTTTTASTTASTTSATTATTVPTNTASTMPATTAATVPATTDGSTPATTAANTASTTPVTTAANTASTTPVTTAANTASTTPFTTAANTASTTPVTTDGTTPATTAATTPVTTATTTTKGPCTPNPCIGNGICEERYGQVFVCTCRPGLVYDNTTGCIPAKVFPGDFTLSDEMFEKEMSDPKSESFIKKAEQIQAELRSALQSDDGYLYSLVLSLRSGSIVAEVRNFYGISSNATTESVESQINQKIPDSFEKKSVCDIGFCDTTTTSCSGDGIAVCTCKKGYIKSEFSTQSCFSCPYGEKAVDTETCKKCDFGFSGFNCNDPNLLVVVVVSCVLGTLLIICVVALIVVCSRKQKVTSSKSKEDFSVEMHKPNEVPRIPRVNPTSNWQPANLEVTKSGSTEALVTKSQRDNKARYTTYDNDSDDGRNGNHDPPVYGGVRVMENGLRGNQNPYYRQDEDRMPRY